MISKNKAEMNTERKEAIFNESFNLFSKIYKDENKFLEKKVKNINILNRKIFQTKRYLQNYNKNMIYCC